MKKSHFLGGALILTVAGLLSKVIGMFYRIPLQKIVGNNGLGLYQEVYPLYLTFLIIATAGVPIALSRFIAEAIASGREAEVKSILARSFVLMGFVGTLFFLLLNIGSPMLANLMGNPHLAGPIRALSYSLLFVPLIAVLRGFFYGRQKMLYVGISQVVEQTLRVTAIMIIATYLVSLGEDTDRVITGVNSGTVASTICSFFILTCLYLWHERGSLQKSGVKWRNLSFWVDMPFFQKMWQVAWPICVSALVIPIFSLVDSFFAINVFRYIWHLDGHTADTWFGIYSRGGSLLQLASMFGASIALSIVPAITEAKQKQDEGQVRMLTKLSYRFAWLIGLPAGLGLTAVAEGTNMALYGDADGTGALAILGISSITLSLLLATNGILQGIGKEKTPAKHLFWGILVKIVATVVGATVLGIDGLSFSWLVATSVVCFLNMRAISRHIKVGRAWRFDLIYPLLTATLMLLLAFGVSQTVGHLLQAYKLSVRLIGAGEAVTGVSVGLIVYLGLLLTIPLVHREELEWMPAGRRLGKLMDYLRVKKSV